MRTLVLSRRPVYPPRNGRQKRTWEECRQLTTYGEVLLATPRASATYPVEGIRHLPLPTQLLTRRLSLFHLWHASLVLGEATPYHRLVSRRIVSLVEAQNVTFDLVTSDSPQVGRAAAMLADRHGSKVLVSKHNAAHDLLETFLTDTPLPTRLCTRAVRTLRAIEQETIEQADTVVFQSVDDREAFEIPSDVRTFHIPNGTDYEQIRAGGNPQRLREQLDLPADRFVCVYVGSYDYFANRAAATTIIEEFAPQLPEVDFLLVGQNPPPADRDNVHAPGFVDDLPGALALADVALCPLTSGSGTKLKMLDYLAAGLPVITTPVGASGIDVENGTSALVREPAEFVRTIEHLRASPERRSELASNAQELGKQYDWASLLSRYDDVVSRFQDAE